MRSRSPLITSLKELAVVQPSILSGETSGLFLLYDDIILMAFPFFACRKPRNIQMMKRSVLSQPPFLPKAEWNGQYNGFSLKFCLGDWILAVFSMSGYDIIAFEVSPDLINWVVLIVSGVLLSNHFQKSYAFGREKKRRSSKLRGSKSC